MAAEGTEVDASDVLVTTGGQQVIDLVCKTLIDPGDVIVAEAPTYPGAVPTFTAYEADVVQVAMDGDGMLIDELEATLDRLESEGRRPKFIYTVPTFQNPGGVTMSLPRRRRLVAGRRRARAARPRGQPLRAPALRGRPVADAALARRRTVRDLPRDVLEDPLPRDPDGLGRGAGAGLREDEHRQAGRRPVLAGVLAVLHRRLLRPRAVARVRRRAPRALPPSPRRHARGAPRVVRPEATWTRPEGGMFVWATLPDYIDTTDLLARALRRERRVRPRPRRVRRRPRRLRDAAQLLRPRPTTASARACAGSAPSCRSRSGCTGPSPARGRCPGRRRPAEPDARMADVLPLPPAATGLRRRHSSRVMRRVAVLKGGRSFERQVSLRSGARVEAALERLGHDVVSASTSAATSSRRCARPRPTSRSWRCTARTARTAPSRSCWRSWASATPARASRPASGARTRSSPSTSSATPGCPRRTGSPSRRRPSASSARRTRCPAIEERLEFPIVIKPAGQGSALGLKVAQAAADVPGALVAAFSYDTKVLLERHVAGRDLAVSVLDGRPLPVVEAIPNDEAAYDFEHRYEIGAHRVPLPRRAAGRRGGARAGAGDARPGRLLGLRRRRARRPHARRRPATSCGCWRRTRSRDDRDLAAADGRRRRGHRLRSSSSRSCSPGAGQRRACAKTGLSRRRRSPPA